MNIPDSPAELATRAMTMGAMHTILEPKLRLGLNLMKFSVNHPNQFKSIIPPFFVGLGGFLAIVATEILSTFYFCMFNDPISVMIKLLGIAFIANIGQVYGNSLSKNLKLKQTDVKSMKITVFRQIRDTIEKDIN